MYLYTLHIPEGRKTTVLGWSMRHHMLAHLRKAALWHTRDNYWEGAIVIYNLTEGTCEREPTKLKLVQWSLADRD